MNIEGISSDKEELLADLCYENKCDILVLQETHRGISNHRPKIQGMTLILERPHEKYGSAIFIKPDLIINSTDLTCNNDIEILTIETQSCTITSVYKPPTTAFNFIEPTNFRNQNTQIVLGDFNCHNTQWGYNETDKNGEDLENWVESQKLKLIHDPKQPASFNSGRWRRGYNPDNIFVSENIAQQTTKHVEKHIPKSQHRPISCAITAAVRPHIVPFKRQFNFKKAKWDRFAAHLDQEIVKIAPVVASYDDFIELVRKVSCKHIPRGCRTHYIAGLDEDSKTILQEYQNLYNQDPFADDTIQTGEQLLRMISTSRNERWTNMVEELDFKRNSRKAWSLLKNINHDPSSQDLNNCKVTPNQIAHQLLINGKTKTRIRNTKIERDIPNENQFLETAFTLGEIQLAIKLAKNNKSPGVDDLRNEQIKHFGPATLNWILKLFDNCISTNNIPKPWRKAKVIALLKPGKDPNEAKNFRPVSLLCHLYKLLERMILNRISEYVDNKLIRQQAGFRPGKSCTGQILNLTQFIEDGFEKKLITGTALLDLSAAYDTINHKLLAYKLYQLTKDYKLTRFIQCLLQNRRFQVVLQNKKSRWQNQKNGLAQGSVLAPLMYNIFTNDQPVDPDTEHFIYADDTAVAAQGNTFEQVESKINKSIKTLAEYYDQNNLKPNPSKSQTCAFHLNNKEAGRKLKIVWRQQQLEHCANPKYLGVQLDRTLSFKQHCINTKKKVFTRNNIIRKLTHSKWGAQPLTLRTSTMALCLSAAEYAAPVWRNSSHSSHVDVSINEAMRIVTGCLKPTPTEKLYPIAGIAPPQIRRQVAAEIEKKKQQSDERHPLYNHEETHQRLKSRKNFMRTTQTCSESPEERRLHLWNERTINPLLELKEEISTGYEQKYTTWKALNRLRTRTTRCKSKLVKWKILEEGNDKCDCGAIQSEDHLLECPNLPEKCTREDLLAANNKALAVVAFWKDSV
ncbi:hypothetical protein M8J77_009365 [Diaphorina citri]|nr:hypothetical protein M8J77_009365 [Diaphorina citri]